ncbi:MFS transporter [Parablautia intestinalis]|uniref:MFS transporter n=1 Tax=Parablautia intestinalis TaxID=2320100 RepID=UPI00256F300C|nr:MFS transporter [Parablautia intestinalis]
MSMLLCRKGFDGVSDLIAGQLIDTHKSKGGHCIPVLLKWTLPTVASVALVFTVPNSTVAVRVAYIFVTYNLFKTVLDTYVCMAHVSLATYVTCNSEERSHMLIFKMLFAALTRTIMASVMLPMVNFFGGQQSQGAWIKSILVFGIIGLVPLALNILLVKERVDNEAPPENIIQGVKRGGVNKYWWMAFVVNLCANFILTFNLSVSVYYLNSVMGNMGVMGTFVACSNMPGVVLCVVCPFLLKKFTKRQMVLFGMGFAMGMAGALIGDCIDYGEWKTGTRVQSVLFSASSVGAKAGQGV